jgi:Flp pilus assembly protein TadG
LSELKRTVLGNEKGVAIIWIGVSLFLIIGVAAIAIDLSFLYTNKNFLHVAADSSSLAAASQIASTTDCMGGVSTDPNYGARKAAQDYGTYNKGGSGAGGKVVLDLNAGNANPDGDVLLGNYSTAAGFVPCPGGNPINAVRVNAAITDAPSFFGGIFGTPISNVGAFATATSGVKGSIPVCVPSCALSPPSGPSACDFSSPTNTLPLPMNKKDKNAAWTGFFDNASASIINNYINNPFEISCVALGVEDINVTQGAIGSAMKNLKNNFDANATNPGTGLEWCVTLPVCDMGCTPPFNGGQLLNDSVTFCMTAVIKEGENKGSSPPPCGLDGNGDETPPGQGCIVGYFECGVGLPGGKCSKLVE